jgi:Icc-related predicted phosphoesterase
MIRIAAVGDVHLAEDTRGSLRDALHELPERADVLLLAGDLTRHGSLDEALVVADEFGDLAVPVIAVLGNHDYHSDQEKAITELLTGRGVTVLDGTGVVLEIGECRLGVAGVKGFCGGFAGKCASAFGEPEMKQFILPTLDAAERLRSALLGLDADARIALTHYSPVVDTLRGEPPEIHPFLGAYQLAESIDEAGADLAIHGHAHFGTEHGITPGGVRVRNVAQPVIRAPYRIYTWEPPGVTTRSAPSDAVSAGR